MKSILKTRWLILILWVVATIVLTWLTPDLDHIINQRGNMTFDDSYPSQVAQKMINSMSTTSGDSGIFVFYDKSTLSSQDMNNIESAIKKLNTQKSDLGITGIVDSFDYPDAKSQLISKDNTTMNAQFTYKNNGRDPQGVVDDLNASLKDLKVSHYVTGSAFISSDFLKQTNEGVEKSAIITVIFILVVLIIMFRSVIAPLISLATVGIAYLTSMGIVGQLIDKFGFPVTSLTRMFLILILFGIGTDYNILLFNRFKEEMKNHANIDDAIKTTYRTAGKTVIFSVMTIFIAFMALNFVKFSVYRSGVAVAVGILVLVVELMTLTPAIFRLFGKRLFWPSKAVEGHRQSRVWERAASFSVKRPYIAMIAIAVLILPVILLGSYKMSFDNLKDMGTDYPSVIGFNTVSDHFSKGTTMPTTIVISNSKPIGNNTDLTAIDNLTEKIRKIKGVNAVMSPTQPQGSEIAELYTDNQTGQVVSGMNSAKDGLSQISGGLDTMKDKLTTPDFSQVGQLVDGTSQLQSGMQSVTTAINQVATGINSGASSAATIADKIDVIKTNLSLVQSNLNDLNDGNAKLEGGYKTFGEYYQSTEQSLSGLVQIAAYLDQTVDADPTYSGIKDNMDLLSSSLTGLDAGFVTLNTQYSANSTSFDALNSGLTKLSGGISQMTDGLALLESGQSALADGLKQGGVGQETIAANMSKMTSGLAAISDGQKQMTGGLSTLGSSLSQLKDGIAASSDGLKQITDGIDKSNDFLTSLESAKTFNLPDAALKSSDFQKSLDAYMSKDRETLKLTVTLNDDPYSDNAIKTVNAINKMMPDALTGTPLSGAKYAIGGETSVTNDLHGIATSDMATTQLIVLIGIFIVLIIVIKSFWIPIYIIGSLLLSFYSSISLTSLFARIFLHTNEITWNVPFFGFVMIVALGVDYSIFLMTRFREYRHITPHEGIIKASANVGGVVLSAAIILAGTFATLAPSGINTLLELAVCVVFGIIILSVILLPIVIPSFISVEDFLIKRYSYNQATEIKDSKKTIEKD